ncbi:MAG: family 78 glycoside hydrolase catalytic domain [Bacteroidales bacterium]|nr:family 78 glycoside hydrolase catalytic domain [Bacteroidales bacterium]
MSDYLFIKPLLCLFALVCLVSCHELEVEIVKPNVEQQIQPQALATAQPRFSWHYESTENDVVQQSYRIIVASTEEKAQQGIGDLWDSQVVKSNLMLYIPYEGKTLKSRDKAYWKVVTEVAKGKRKTSLESEVNKLEISLLNQDDWKARWIGHEFDEDIFTGHTRIPARYLRKEFTLSSAISEARLYVSGLGVYSAYLNGNEIAPEELLKPTLSWYPNRVYFNTYEVTEMLNEGSNAIGVILEGGRYTTIRNTPNPNGWDGTEFIPSFGTPRMILQLEVTYKDGHKDLIVSDETWKITNQGPIRTANEYDGETYDENYELGNWTFKSYDDTAWLQAELVEAPEGQLSPQPNPNITVMEQLKPVAIFPKGDKWMLDMGQNMVGFLEVESGKWSVESGDTITLRFAELLTPDSLLYTANLRGAECRDRYIIASGSRHCERSEAIHSSPSVDGHIAPQSSAPRNDSYHPTFVYHGFRYVEITGLREKPSIDDFEGWVIYDEMPTTGSFECSNEIINAVYRNAYWGIRGNYRSMPTDCPQRDERMGWTGDRTTGNYGESYIFNNHQLYAKWLSDAEDSQWDNGSLPNVIPPYWRGYTDNLTWPGAVVTATDMLFTRYGDTEPIHQHYDSWKRWLLHIKEKYMKDGIIHRDTYGDWCMPPESLEMIHSNDPKRITDGPLLSTPFYCYLCGKMAKFAKVMGLDADADYFNNEIETTTAAFNHKYFNYTHCYYGNNTVTANILPLSFGMAPKDLETQVFANIVNKTENECDGHVSTGVIGIQLLMRCLTEFGRGDLALKIAANDTYPSWGYMVRNGATTIWELWNGNTADPAMNSGNHVMLLGDLLLWEYEYLAGIRVDHSITPSNAQRSTLNSKLTLKPYPIEELDYVNCTYESVSGRIESHWKREGNLFEWEFVIPANTTAEVWIPTANGYETKIYGSGKYHLTSKL